MAQHLWRAATYYEMPNQTVPNTIQIENGGKQEASNKEFKHTKGKTYKKASLSTSLTNLYANKLSLQSKQKIRFNLSKVTSENTRAGWAISIADWECTEINYEMIPEMSDIPDKYGNLALMCSLSALQENRVKTSLLQQINKLTRCYYAMSIF